MISVLHSGGPVLWTIALIGLASTAIFFVRFIDLRRAHVVYVDFMAGVANLISKENEREALAICEETPTPVARVVAAAIRHRRESVSAIREAAEVAARAEASRFSRRLSVLQTVAQISPLLGLFGTMVGFAHALAAISGNALATRSDLIPAMGPALACAAAGLLVAVCVYVMHALLKARLKHLAADLDATVRDIVSRLGGAGA